MTQQQPPRHKVFISFHHDDQEYKDRFVRGMGHDFVDESVNARPQFGRNRGGNCREGWTD